MVSHRVDRSHGESPGEDRPIRGILPYPTGTESHWGRASEVALGEDHRVRDETGECCRDFLIPHLVQELLTVRENEIPIEGRDGLSMGCECLQGHGQAARAGALRPPCDPEARPRGYPPLKAQGARTNGDPNSARDAEHGPVRRL